MGIELCIECFKLFDTETSVEAPKKKVIPFVLQSRRGYFGDPMDASMSTEITYVWCCPTCSLEESV